MNELLIALAYRLILGRAPETEQVVQDKAERHDSLASLRAELMDSAEFREQYAKRRGAELPGAPIARAQVDGRFFIYGHLDDTAVSVPCLRGRYEPEETRLIQSLLEDGQVFVDAGAQVGWHALNIASTRPHSPVIAIEPRTTAFECLRMGVSESGFEDRIRCVKVACWDAPGEGQLRWSGGDHALGSGSVSEAPGLGVSEREPADPSCSDEPVELATIQAVVEAAALPAERAMVGVIRLDLAGAETRALTGARELLAQHQPALIVDVDSESLGRLSSATISDLVSFLDGLGYSGYQLDRGDPGGLSKLDATSLPSPRLRAVFSVDSRP